MFDKTKAAQYFVVAWVKGWTLRMYLEAVSDGDHIDWADAHKHYPWLPHTDGPFIRNTNVRRWVAEAMRVINDRLWDAPDDTTRLALSGRIERWNSVGADMNKNLARAAMRDAQQNLHRANGANDLSVAQMRRGSGHDWAVCK